MSLNFSSVPGARERHLKRQYKNSLFSPEYRNFDEQRLSGAQYMDNQEEQHFYQNFQQLLEEVSALKPNESSETLLDIKSRLDQSYEQCCGLGGEHDEAKQAIARLVEIIMKTIQQSAAGDAEAEINLQEEALARSTHYRLLEYPIVADLLRPKSPIAHDQLVASLLSESENSVKAAFQLFDQEQKKLILEESKTLLKERLEQGFELPEAWQRLKQIQALTELES